MAGIACRRTNWWHYETGDTSRSEFRKCKEMSGLFAQFSRQIGSSFSSFLHELIDHKGGGGRITAGLDPVRPLSECARKRNRSLSPGRRAFRSTIGETKGIHDAESKPRASDHSIKTNSRLTVRSTGDFSRRNVMIGVMKRLHGLPFELTTPSNRRRFEIKTQTRSPLSSSARFKGHFTLPKDRSSFTESRATNWCALSFSGVARFRARNSIFRL